MKKILHFPLFYLLTLSLILRLPSLFEPYWYLDEAMYLTIGDAMRHGLKLYTDIFDNKPPGIYFLAMLAPSLFYFKLISTIFALASVTLFYKLVGKLDVPNRLQLLASLVFVLLTSTPVLEGNIANAEIFLMTFTLAGLYLFFRDEHAVIPAKAEIQVNSRRVCPTLWRTLIVGFLFGIAFLFKIHALFELMALLTFIWISHLHRLDDLRELIVQTSVLTLGFVLPIASFIFLFHSQGTLSEFIYSSLLSNFSYVNAFAPPEIIGGVRITLFLRLAVLSTFLAFFFKTRKRFTNVEILAYLWFLLALFAVLLSSRNYPHYLLQLTPPLSLILALQLLGKIETRISTTILILLLVFSLQFYNFQAYPILSYYDNVRLYLTGQRDQEAYLNRYDSHVTLVNEVSAYLRTNLDEGDRIFVIDNLPQIYTLSKRLPALKYITLFQLMDQEDAENIVSGLLTTPPDIIVEIDWNDVTNPEVAQVLHQIMERDYKEETTIRSATLWRRKH